MRTHLLRLLLLILLSSSAQALKCHECSATGNCFQPTTCSTMTRYCLISWYSPPGQQTSVTKTCAFTCPDVHQSMNYSRDFCCNTDLCNSTTSLHASWALLTLSICFLYLRG